MMEAEATFSFSIANTPLSNSLVQLQLGGTKVSAPVSVAGVGGLPRLQWSIRLCEAAKTTGLLPVDGGA